MDLRHVSRWSSAVFRSFACLCDLPKVEWSHGSCKCGLEAARYVARRRVLQICHSAQVETKRIANSSQMFANREFGQCSTSQQNGEAQRVWDLCRVALLTAGVDD
jgi:hypothetical protein